MSDGLEHAIGLHRQGRLDEAEAIYNGLLADAPDNAEILGLLGVLAFHRGRLDEAESRLGQAIARDPDTAKYHANLGNVRAAARRFAPARDALERAIALDPGNADAHNALCVALRELGDNEGAIAAGRMAVAADPSHAMAHGNLALALSSAGRAEEALTSARDGVAAEPANPGLLNTLALCQAGAGQGEAAVTTLETAIERAPDYPESYSNIGRQLIRLDRLAEAESRLRELLERTPRDAGGHAALATALRRQGRIEAATPHYRRAVALAPGDATARSNMLYALNANPEISDADLLAAHREWNRVHAAPLASQIPPHDNVADSDRPLRVGYVSPDFRQHPVGTYMLPVLAHHDPERVEAVCYAQLARPDRMTERLKASARIWRDVTRLDDAAVAARVRADNIDILIDLAGHTAGHRLGVFARKPAPIQASWMGYPFSTGLDAMDYLIGDPVETPEQTEHLFTETVLRLPVTMVACDGLEDAPPVGPLPALSGAPFTFGSLNNPGKLNDATIALWARILAEMPQSRLLLKAPVLDDAVTAQRLRERFAGHGIDPARIELHGRTSWREALDTYNRIDIALDTFPYTGSMTTVEALWMGAPVVSMAGTRTASRMTAGHLTTVGLTELIADGPDAYVATALGLAADRDRLSRLRDGMRERVAASALCDGAGLTRALERLYRDMWRRWCAERQSRLH